MEASPILRSSEFGLTNVRRCNIRLNMSRSGVFSAPARQQNIITLEVFEAAVTKRCHGRGDRS